ncbi:MauE/DoxX family redox-associated membrane protein [Filimonas effusa]|uniref:DoxX family membrane protein n=1 Tax=Filimonas effusa TaxID=2508721 RepID=A0A4Q1DDL8_9BACT|nr:MauE/DoxX family redox-associated membrane protein [Filimonas effusa]RXK86975.1 DoxX family membrane protein [Filimonas effusa]
MKISRFAYFVLRLPIALSLLGHGLVRLPKLSGFSNWMTTLMAKSILPSALIVPFSYAVPFIEFITGLLLLIGLFTRQVLYVGIALMAVFIFGNTTIENWEPITSQLVHAGYMAALLLLLPYCSSWEDIAARKSL